MKTVTSAGAIRSKRARRRPEQSVGKAGDSKRPSLTGRENAMTRGKGRKVGLRRQMGAAPLPSPSNPGGTRPPQPRPHGLFKPNVKLDTSQIRDLRPLARMSLPSPKNQGGTPSREQRAQVAATKINAGRAAVSRTSSRSIRKPAGRGFGAY